MTLIFLYAQALVRPEEHAEFIFRVGMATYLIEFLSIHSSGMLFGGFKDKKKKWFYRFFLLGIYAIFVFAFMAALHCWFIGIYFFASLCAKIFLSKSVKDNINQSQIAFSCINLLCSTFAVIPLAPLLKKLFPISQSIISEHAGGASGLFVDTPQTLLTWGILYFSLTIVFNFVMFFKHTPRIQNEN
ncbi:MAG: hypothetical protein ACYTEN_03850 [Planctomycetota bacterium]